MLRAHLADCRWFWVWAIVGCAAAVGFVSLGVLVLVPVAVAGVVLLYIAWLQRAGPGHLNPLPWLLVGIALFVGGIVAHARRGLLSG